MPLFKLNTPNEDVDAMEADGGDYAENIASVANAVGLIFVKETDYGAVWRGTMEQFAACVEALPEWAQPFASVEAKKTIREWMEDNGCSTDENSYLPQENMNEEVFEEFMLSDGSRVAFTRTSYVFSHGAGHSAGEDCEFSDDHPAWAEEVSRLRYGR